jgi:mono/diheme cytochrome c family protein
MVRTCGQKFVWALALVAIHGMTARPAIADDDGQMSPEHVRKMFATNCSWCHGDFGKKAGKGPKLAGTSMSEKQVHDRIANGAPGGAMPSYKKLLTEEQINALVAYIKGLPSE